MIKWHNCAWVGIATTSLLASSIASPSNRLQAQTPPKPPPLEQQVQDVVEHLIGVMDTSAQAETQPDAPNARMTTCQIRVSDSEEVFLYQEQALSESLERPYRQRFLRIAPSSDRDTVESRSYKPLNSERWKGLCDRAPEERTAQLGDMEDAKCSVFLMPANEMYIGNTQAGGCETNVRGAVRITNTILLHSAGMDTWDRGLDASGNRVWGADGQAYQYRWIQ
ncbi:MAG: chromophore lyase CpcT/CpeT [Cyanobacteriota bacterium]|nr:chromophore lyase CpcT/CpeT [Cyanobacteriota bacterium]